MDLPLLRRKEGKKLSSPWLPLSDTVEGGEGEDARAAASECPKPVIRSTPARSMSMPTNVYLCCSATKITSTVLVSYKKTMLPNLMITLMAKLQIYIYIETLFETQGVE